MFHLENRQQQRKEERKRQNGSLHDISVLGTYPQETQVKDHNDCSHFMPTFALILGNKVKNIALAFKRQIQGIGDNDVHPFYRSPVFNIFSRVYSFSDREEGVKEELVPRFSFFQFQILSKSFNFFLDMNTITHPGAYCHLDTIEITFRYPGANFLMCSQS